MSTYGSPPQIGTSFCHLHVCLSVFPRSELALTISSCHLFSYMPKVMHMLSFEEERDRSTRPAGYVTVRPVADDTLWSNCIALIEFN